MAASSGRYSFLSHVGDMLLVCREMLGISFHSLPLLFFGPTKVRDGQRGVSV